MSESKPFQFIQITIFQNRNLLWYKFLVLNSHKSFTFLKVWSLTSIKQIEGERGVNYFKDIMKLQFFRPSVVFVADLVSPDPGPDSRSPHKLRCILSIVTRDALRGHTVSKNGSISFFFFFFFFSSS